LPFDGGALIDRFLKAFLTDQAVFFIELLDRLAATGYREMRRHGWGGHYRRITMTNAELEQYRQELLALQSRLNGDVAYLADEALGKPGEEATCNLSHVPIHMADLGTASFEQQFTLSLMENEEQVLEEIAAAWDRIDQGTFGRCEECGKEIPKARLLVLPFTSFCVECARVVQRSD
jgi:DnaK suppressor protein